MTDAERSGIYAIVNKLNGKRYVGSAKVLSKRKREHFARLKKGNHHSTALQHAWDKYGEGAFVFDVLLTCSPESLLAEEQAEIDKKSEYNMTIAAGSCLGRVLSPETRAKIGARKVGMKLPPRSEEYRRKMSSAHKGKPKSEAQMAALQSARRAYVMTEEDKLIRSQGMKRAYASGLKNPSKDQPVRDKIAQTLRERSKDPEIKKKLSNQASSYWSAMTEEERKARCAHMRAGQKRNR